jgi:hypothetical protein
MSLEIDIRSNFTAIGAAFEELKTVHIVQAARRAINRSLISTRKESIAEIKKKLKMKTGEIKERTKMLKARGSKLHSLEGKLIFSGIPVPLLTFVRGNKDVIQLKGKKIKNRRKLRAEVTPGKRFIVKGAFIQRARTKQVFKGKKKRGFKKQGAPSIGHIVREKEVGNVLARFGAKRFRDIFLDEVDKRIRGVFKSAAIGGVKKP